MILKKITYSFVFCICFSFLFSFLVFAEDTLGDDQPGYRWVHLEATLPGDFPALLSIYLKNTDTKEKQTFYLRPENEFSSYESIAVGNYIIDDVKVDGGDDGYFDIGYSTESFEVKDTEKDPMEIPFLLTVSSNTSTVENPYEGLTYEETMKKMDSEVRATQEYEEDEDLEETEITSDGLYDTEENSSSPSSDENLDSSKETIESKENVKQKEKAMELQKKETRSFWGGLGFTLILLIGLGIGFYYVKKKHSV